MRSGVALNASVRRLRDPSPTVIVSQPAESVRAYSRAGRSTVHCPRSAVGPVGRWMRCDAQLCAHVPVEIDAAHLVQFLQAHGVCLRKRALAFGAFAPLSVGAAKAESAGSPRRLRQLAFQSIQALSPLIQRRQRRAAHGCSPTPVRFSSDRELISTIPSIGSAVRPWPARLWPNASQPLPRYPRDLTWCAARRICVPPINWSGSMIWRDTSGAIRSHLSRHLYEHCSTP